MDGNNNEIREIGGYFGLELPEPHRFLRDGEVAVNSASHALEYIIRSHPGVDRVWLPSFTCDVVFNAVRNAGAEVSFYRIDETLMPADRLPVAKDNEMVVINNYFGMMSSEISSLVEDYPFPSRLIADNAQAWWGTRPAGCCYILSPRKFFGLPDGGILHMPHSGVSIPLERGHSWQLCSHLLERLDYDVASVGYDDFRKNSVSLHNMPVEAMSSLTSRILSSIDFHEVARRRVENYNTLQEKLSPLNSFPYLADNSVPMVYPLLLADVGTAVRLRRRLIGEKIFVATYWPNIREWWGEDSAEWRLSQTLVPIPIDQRYNTKDMKRIIEVIASEIS